MVVAMTEPSIPSSTNPFADLGLSDTLLRAVTEVGFEEPMPVQAETIPVMLAGRDVIVQAHTGTGKTAAFALPILQKLEPEGTEPQALVLTPTRELAMQVAQTFHRLGKHVDARVLAVYGGQPIERQLRALRHPVDVVVGTPGRIMDHLRRETLSLRRVRVVVLDEADEMLNMGFIEDVEWILDRTPRERQTGLFSATIPDRIADLAQRYLHAPVRIAIEPEHVTAPRITQVYYEVALRAKVDALARILDLEGPASAIIFCRTKSGVDELVHALQALGYSAEAIHGDMSQLQRDRVMSRFRSGLAQLLIATDLAARGLDIPAVSHVINYDIPSDPESYVHRIGRTGRAGAPGMAITLVTPRERWMLRTIERAIGQRLEQRTTPSRQQIIERQRALLGASLVEIIEKNDLSWALRLVDDLAAYHDPAVVAAAAVKLLAQQRNLDPERASALFDEEMDQPEPGMTRLLLSLGRRDGLRPMDVVGAIANEARIPGKRIGQIEIGERQTTVEVPDELVDRVVRALSRTRLRGKPVRVETMRRRAASQ